MKLGVQEPAASCNGDHRREKENRLGPRIAVIREEASGSGLTDTAWPGDWRKRLSREFLSQRKEVVTLKSVATAVPITEL